MTRASQATASTPENRCTANVVFRYCEGPLVAVVQR